MREMNGHDDHIKIHIYLRIILEPNIGLASWSLGLKLHGSFDRMKTASACMHVF